MCSSSVRYRKVPAFTLVEALVAMTVLTVGIIGVLEAFSQGMKFGARVTRREKALDIAQCELELAAMVPDEPGGPQTLGPASPENPFKCRISSKPLGQGLARVSVEVRWQEDAIDQQIVLSRVCLPKSSTAPVESSESNTAPP